MNKCCTMPKFMMKVKLYLQTSVFSVRIDCNEGYFGEVCELNCSANCKTKRCDIDNGSCKCKVGYAGNPCTRCPSNCDFSGCNDDFYCKICNPGFYGDCCNKTCSEHCEGNRCGKDGRCKCNVGYAGHPCKECPINCDINTGCNDTFHCHTCKQGFYDNFCNKTCSDHCLNKTCHRYGRCVECDRGFYGDYCNLTCSTNCINGTCNRDGSCNCKKGFDGFGCCPEKCEGGCYDTNFVCSSCKEGYHGDFCTERCPDNCKNGCTHDEGKCHKCIKGYWGDRCDKGKKYFNSNLILQSGISQSKIIIQYHKEILFS